MSQQPAWTGGTTVSREHTELHEVIYGYFGPSTAVNSYKSPDQQDHELTDVILAAGWVKPRTITTVAELDALPEGSVVLSGGVVPRIRTESGWVGDGVEVDSDHIIYWTKTATVLHEGQA